MNCRYCGSTLQPGALFCVECGRSVAEPPAPRAAPTPGAAPPRADAPAPRPAEAPAPGVHCPQCGSVVDRADIFCTECGFVLRSMAGAIAPESPATPEVPAPETPTPAPEPPAPAPESPDEVESTRMMASRGHGERYVLQFSTGESIVVAGTGLIGRNPAPEPGEYVDELVSIFDVGKSVSKSHVEFGQDSGRFWVSDRYSTNGTVIRQPDGDPVRCEPGKRYLITRGSRVEIGEQFFIVS